MKTAASFAAVSLGALLCATGAHPSSGAKPHKIPTFAHDVAPIVYSKCAPCHHEGEVAPFTLTSYRDARSKAKTIAAAVRSGYMPPWQAVSHGEFLNERTLTAAQIETLQDWANSGAPEGDAAREEKAPSFTPGWQMGTPDLVVSPERPYPVTAEGRDDYRCFVMPTHFNEDRYVTGVELRPGNRKIVHHVLVYLDTLGAARKIKSNDGKPGYGSFGGPGFAPTGSLGGWAPGLQPYTFDNGNGMLLPKGADIVLQVHYHKDGKAETDLTKLGLRFAKAPVDKRIRWNAIGDELLEIPAGDSHYPVTASMKLSRDVTVLDVIPHMHLLGHDMVVTATLPDGKKEKLIDVDRYDFNWQTRYSYREPVHLPAGTTLSLVAHYDNSSANPRNPNSPPKLVTFGEQTTNEMCFAFFSYTVDKEHLARGQKASEEDDFSASDAEYKRLFDKFDADHDGYLDAKELANLIRFFSSEPASTDGKPTKADQGAALAVAFYGKTVKGKLSLAEFVKLAKERKD